MDPILFGQPIIAVMTVAHAPTTARWRVRAPGASDDTVYVTGTDAEATLIAANTYQLAILPDQVGDWIVRFEGVGDYPDAAEMIVTVEPSKTIAAALA
jgi:hypothetical protein